jgi:hypothetical protein
MKALTNTSYLKPLAVICIVILAALLRCYHLFEIPLINDELSALNRLRFPSFAALIRQGVMPDGHPALVQVFLFYYTKLTGLSPALIKLPFIICGTAGVYVAYRVFGRLLNSRTGLLVAAFMATSQFFIMHSQTARPYAPGLLFVLLLTQQLLVVWEGKAQKRHYVFIALLLVLLASTHYLAALTGAVIVMLFLWNAGPFRKPLLVACGVAALLYIPQLPVLIQHMKIGGIGTWLGKPQPGYIIGFARYLTQFNAWVLVLFGAGIPVSLYLALCRSDEHPRKKLLTLIGVFTITYLVLYCYSVWRNPLLQYPALLFATPFLLAFAFYAFTRLPRPGYIILLFTLIAAQCYALTVSRRHYRLFYDQSYQAVVQDIGKYAGINTPLLLNGNAPYYFDFYFEREGIKPNILHSRIDTLSYADFGKLLHAVKADTIVIAHAFDLAPEYFSMARSVFPDSVYGAQRAFNETWILARSKAEAIAAPVIQFDSSRTHGAPVQFSLRGPLRFLLEAQGYIMQTGSADPELALSVKNSRGEQVLWRSAFYHSFNPVESRGGNVFVASAIAIPENDVYRFEISVINGKGETFTASQPKVRVSKSNGLLFGTVEPVYR